MIDEYSTGSEKPDGGGIIGLFLGGAPRSAYIIGGDTSSYCDNGVGCGFFITAA